MHTYIYICLSNCLKVVWKLSVISLSSCLKVVWKLSVRIFIRLAQLQCCPTSSIIHLNEIEKHVSIYSKIHNL